MTSPRPNRIDPTNPLQNASFRKLFSAQVIALVGTGLSTVALTLLAYDRAGESAAVVLGTALTFKMAAYVVFAPIVGGLSQRLPRKPFLIAMDVVRAGVVLTMPFVTEIWQIYALIFVLNVFSAGFKPVFAATIPDILPEERQFTRALSMSRLAYDLENLLSPLLAGAALLLMTYAGLFIANALAFAISAVLIVLTAFPPRAPFDRLGTIRDEISFGVRSYLRTPRLRGLLALYLAVASASAMVIVNTVVYVRQVLGGNESDVALALAASGGGSMLAALSVPKLLDRAPDRSVMLVGSVLMAVGLGLTSLGPSLTGLLPVWFLIGLGWSLVQTPAGRVVNRSSAPMDRPAYFSAQFALSHCCWLILYPVAGQLGVRVGVESTALTLGIAVLAFTMLAAALWPAEDPEVLEHTHEAVTHQHRHEHDLHHRHTHAGWEGPEPHGHLHTHAPVQHRHLYAIDDHHCFWPE